MAKTVRAGKSFVEVYLDKTKLMRGLKDAKKAVANFASDVRKIGKISLAAGLSLQALGTMAAKRFASVGDTIAKMARRTGIGVEAISELGYAAELSGSSLADVEKAIRRMQRSIYDAGRGLSTATDALTDLDLSFQQLNGLSPDEQFRLIGERLAAIEDPTKKAAIAMSLFGRSGTMLLPMLDNVGELADEAKRLGLTMTADMAMRAEKLTDIFTRLKRSIDMVVINIGSALEPIISSTTETITRITVKINEWLRENDKIIQSVYSFVPVLIAAGAALIAISNPLGALTAVIIGFGIKYGVTMNDVRNATVTATSAIGELVKYLQQTFSVMTEALIAGDYISAAKAFWVGLQIVWIDGVEKIKQIMAEIAISFFDVISDMASGMSSFDGIFNGLMAGINWVRKGFMFLQETIMRTLGNIISAYEAVRNIFADFIKEKMPSGKEYAEALKTVADEIKSERQSIDTSPIETSTKAGSIADRIRKAEEERRKAAAEGNSQRKRELEEQLKILKQQTKAAEGLASVQTTGLGVSDTFDAMARQTSESIGMFGGSVLDRLGLGTTIESNSERYLKETAEATKATADALGA